MSFIFSTPVLIRHLWQLKTVVFLHWCLICALQLSDGANLRISFRTAESLARLETSSVGGIWLIEQINSLKSTKFCRNKIKKKTFALFVQDNGLALPANITLGWKGLPGTDTLAY